MAPLTQSLWHLYVAGLTWIALPGIGSVVKSVFPLTPTEFGEIATALAVSAVPLGVWSGLRGGPLMLSETDVLYGLVGRRRRLVGVGAVIRQTLTVGVVAALALALLSVLAAGDHFVLADYMRASAIGMAWGMAVAVISALVSPAVDWLPSQPTPQPARAPSWDRAIALSDVRIAANVLDVRGALVSLRRVRDGDRRPRLPLRRVLALGPLAHPVTSTAALPVMALARIALLFAFTAATLTLADGRTRILLTGLGLLLIGVDASGSLAAAADGQLLLRGRGRRLLAMAGELVFTVAVVLVAALAAWLVSMVADDVLPLRPLLGLAVGSALAAAVQARLGTPDFASYAMRFGPGQLGWALGARSAAPILIWFLTVLMVSWSQVDGRHYDTANSMVLAAVIGAWVVRPESGA